MKIENWVKWVPRPTSKALYTPHAIYDIYMKLSPRRFCYEKRLKAQSTKLQNVQHNSNRVGFNSSDLKVSKVGNKMFNLDIEFIPCQAPSLLRRRYILIVVMRLKQFSTPDHCTSGPPAVKLKSNA